ncbi:MAG: YlbF family regulator [Dethiobacteria bacterium]
MNPYDSAHALAAALKKSTEFQAFAQAFRRLKDDSTANSIIEDFRRMQIEIQQLHIEGQEVPAEKEEKYKKLAEIANMNLVVKNYVEAEYRLAVLVGDIQRIIAEAIEVEK